MNSSFIRKLLPDMGLSRHLALLSIVGCLSACTTGQMYHREQPVVTLAEGSKNPVKLGYVEIDDQGELQDFQQLTAVTNEIKAQSRRGKLQVILFVHGWNNNAAEGSNSHESFKTALQAIQVAQQQNGGKNVFGVFIGWRGRTLTKAKPLLDFFHRYQGGHRVGTGAGTDAIYEVAASARNANPENSVILIGHSFGGLVLEDAVSQPIRARLAESHASGSSQLDSRDIIPADLVILLNEAQHAVKARQLVSALRDRQISTGDKDLPWIVSITSRTDNATGKSFPASVFLGRNVPPFNLFNTSVSGRYRQEDIGPNAGSQREAASHTAGHFPPLHSHEVTRLRDNNNLGKDDQLSHIMANLNPQHGGGIVFHCSAGDYEIKRRPSSANPYNTTPYWIMDVPKEIIADHGDIWSAKITGLVTSLIHLRSQRVMDAAPTAPQTYPAARLLNLKAL